MRTSWPLLAVLTLVYQKNAQPFAKVHADEVSVLVQILLIYHHMMYASVSVSDACQQQLLKMLNHNQL